MAEAPTSDDRSALQSLTSGLRREVRGGSLQAHVCTITSVADVAQVTEACQAGTWPSFEQAASCSYAYRLLEEPAPGEASGLREGLEDGLDEGCGEKILGVLRRSSVQGLLLLVTRWQDHGRTLGLELYGLELYGLVVERCKDLLTNLKLAVSSEVPRPLRSRQERRSQTFDFSFLPSLPEPRVATKYGPNHFLYDTPMNKPRSLRSLLSGGDVQMWMANDEALRHLEERELCALRSLRQPDARIERSCMPWRSFVESVLRTSVLIRQHDGGACCRSCAPLPCEQS